MEIRECEFCHSREIIRTVVNEVYPSNGEYLLIEDIPVWRCTQCGEKYYEAEVLINIERLLEKRVPVLRTVQMPVLGRVDELFRNLTVAQDSILVGDEVPS